MCAFVFLKLFLENWGIKCNTDLSDIISNTFSHVFCVPSIFIVLENNLKVSHWKTTKKLVFKKYGNFLLYLSICKLLTFPTFIQFQCHFENSACSLSQKSPIWKTFYWRSLFQEERWNRVLDGLKRDIFLATTATLAM